MICWSPVFISLRVSMVSVGIAQVLAFEVLALRAAPWTTRQPSARAVAGEAGDLAWAPISAYLVYQLYGNGLISGLAFAEALLPGLRPRRSRGRRHRRLAWGVCPRRG